MPLIYLDSNIISYLHHPEDYSGQSWQTDAPAILGFFEQDPHSAVLFSPAHLMDIRKGFKKDQQRALEKLQFLARLTKRRQLTKYFGSHEMRVEEVDPEAFFMEDNEYNAEFHAPGKKRLNYLSLIRRTPAYDRLKTKRLDFERVKRVLSAIPIKLKWTRKDPTAYNLMCDFAVFLGEMIENDFIIYKPFREQAIRETGLADKLALQEDPLSFLQTHLTATVMGQRIREGMNELLADDPNDREGIIFGLFMNLDFLGFKRDKITDGHGYMSLAADATHCFYASYCDLFVTDDERTAKKTEAVYKHLKIPTKVLTMRQLVDWVKAHQSAEIQKGPDLTV